METLFHYSIWIGVAMAYAAIAVLVVRNVKDMAERISILRSEEELHEDD